MKKFKLLWILPKGVCFDVAFDLFTTKLLIDFISKEPDFEQYLSTIELLSYDGYHISCKCLPFNKKILDGTKVDFQDALWLKIDFFDLAFIRVDPPVDEVFRHALILMSIAEEKGDILFINSPKLICNKGSKIFNVRFVDLMASTKITANFSEAIGIIQARSDVRWVLKPLDRGGGNGVIQISSNSKDLRKDLVQMFSTYGYIQLQIFLPQIEWGEERHIIFNNQIIASWLKVPAQNDFRANMDQGATVLPLKDSKNILTLKSLIKRIGQENNGLVFYSVDFIGGYVNEINIENVGGLPYADKLYHRSHASLIVKEIREILLSLI